MNELVVKYGPEVCAICVAAIFLVGCMKLIFKKGFDKVEKTARKTVYESLSIVMAFGLTALWLFIKSKYFGGEQLTWALFGAQGGVVYVAVKATYALYENFKLRDLLQVMGKGVLSIFTKKKKKEEVKSDEEPENKVNVI